MDLVLQTLPRIQFLVVVYNINIFTQLLDPMNFFILSKVGVTNGKSNVVQFYYENDSCFTNSIHMLIEDKNLYRIVPTICFVDSSVNNVMKQKIFFSFHKCIFHITFVSSRITESITESIFYSREKHVS